MVKISKVALQQATKQVKGLSDIEVMNFLRCYWNEDGMPKSEQDMYLKQHKPRFMATQIMAMVITEFESVMNKQ